MTPISTHLQYTARDPTKVGAVKVYTYKDRGNFFSLADTLIQSVWSFLFLQDIWNFKSTTKSSFLSLLAGNVQFHYKYHWTDHDRTKFLKIMSNAVKIENDSASGKYNCIVKNIIFEAPRIQFREDCPTITKHSIFHDKNIWFSVLSFYGRTITHLKIRDPFFHVSKEGFEALKELTLLENVDIGMSQDSHDIGLKYWNKFANLRSIKTHNIDDAAIKEFSKLDKLEEFTIVHPNISNESLMTLSISNIKTLTIIACMNINEDCLDSINPMPCLEELNLLNCPKMKRFSNYAMETEELQHVAEKMPRLKRFNGHDLSPYRVSPVKEITPNATSVDSVRPLDADDGSSLQSTSQPIIQSIPQTSNTATPTPQPVVDSSQIPPAPTPIQQDQPSEIAGQDPPTQYSTTTNQLTFEQPPPNPTSEITTQQVTNNPPQGSTDYSEATQQDKSKFTTPTEQPPTQGNPAADRKNHSWFAQLCSSLSSCFARLWACLCALFCRQSQ